MKCSEVIAQDHSPTVMVSAPGLLVIITTTTQLDPVIAYMLSNIGQLDLPALITTLDMLPQQK